MTHEQFDEILEEICNEEDGGCFLSIPGIYEILSEYYNNEILDRAKAAGYTIDLKP